jgi:hypothetical protein
MGYKVYSGVEQLAARRAHNPKVPGSSPGPATSRDFCRVEPKQKIAPHCGAILICLLVLVQLFSVIMFVHIPERQHKRGDNRADDKSGNSEYGDAAQS